jgi:hypothetical protein
MGGDTESDGVGTIVRDNRLTDNEGYGLKIMTRPQGPICGNVVEGNGDGATNVDDIDPTHPCPG